MSSVYGDSYGDLSRNALAAEQYRNGALERALQGLMSAFQQQRQMSLAQQEAIARRDEAGQKLAQDKFTAIDNAEKWRMNALQTADQLKLYERSLDQTKDKESPADIRDREFQQKMLYDLGATGGIESVDQAKKLAPNASPTVHQLSYEASMSVRKPAEQLYQNASRSASLLNVYDNAVQAAGGADKPVPEPGGVYSWFDNPDKADQRKKVNDAVALMKKLGPTVNRLRQSQLVQQDPDSMQWVPAVAKPRWLKDEMVTPQAGASAPAPDVTASPDAGGYSRLLSESVRRQQGDAGQLNVQQPPVAPGMTPGDVVQAINPQPTATGTNTVRRYPQAVYDRVRQLTGQGTNVQQALTQALREQAVFGQ